jgi:acetyl esterase/lipase
MKALILIFLVSVMPLHAGDPAPFFRDLEGNPAEAGNVIDNDGRIRRITAPVLRIFKSRSATPIGRVLLLPGGGYTILSAVKEGSVTAELLNSAGYDVAILEYRVSSGPETRDLALKDCQQAWNTVLTRPQSCGLRGKRTAIMGYSAGGHLAARTLMNLAPDGQPDDLILIYPAYLDETAANGGKPLVTPPERTGSLAFILIAKNDRPQWVAGSEAFSKAWSAAGGKTVFHLLPDGGHGFGTAAPMTGLLKDFLSKR